MNLILLFDTDFVADNRVRLTGRRMVHIKKVHRARSGDRLSVGRLNGSMGRATVCDMAKDHVDLVLLPEALPPPPPLPVTLVVALPRPKMLRRILQTIAALGVKSLFLINTWRVEKSFWSSDKMTRDHMEKELILGLEQGRDTQMPQVHLRRLFAPFVREELPDICRGKKAVVAHPGAVAPCPPVVCGPAVLALGPEGGFIQREVETFMNMGFTGVTLGERILRLETAVPYLLSRFHPCSL